MGTNYTAVYEVLQPNSTSIQLTDATSFPFGYSMVALTPGETFAIKVRHVLSVQANWTVVTSTLPQCPEVSAFCSILPQCQHCTLDGCIANVLTCSAPAAPTNIATTSQTTSVEVIWFTPGNVSHVLSLQPGGQTVTLPPSVLFYQFMGLTKATDYVLEIKSFNSEQESTVSSNFFRTLGEAPSAPSDVAVLYSCKVGFVSWKSSDILTDNYAVRISANGFWETPIIIGELFADLTLLPNTFYNISVSALKDEAESDRISAPSFITPSCPLAQPSVPFVSVSVVNVIFDVPIPAGFANYSVNILTPVNMNITSDNPIITTSALENNRDYTATVRYCSSKACSLPSDEFSFATMSGPPPPVFSIEVAVTAHSALVTWDHVFGGTSFRVSLSGGDYQEVFTTDLEFRFFDLVPLHSYTVSFVTIFNNAESNPSSKWESKYAYYACIGFHIF